MINRIIHEAEVTCDVCLIDKIRVPFRENDKLENLYMRGWLHIYNPYT